MISKSWPGMDLNTPEVNRTHEKPRIELWCPEARRPREIAWAGFGFQVWCQMLTHVVRWKNSSIFLIDEPDIYLHSDLQRQLLGILKSLGPDIVLATHSTEIVTEAETEDIVLIDKRRNRSRRLKRPDQLSEVFRLLGSTINPVLTQVAKTRRVLFVEGDDFNYLSRFARRLGYERVANRADFAVVRAEGFNPERIRNLKEGMEETLGVNVNAAVVLDSDYRSRAECNQVESDCRKHCQFAAVHTRKELENFLLVPEAIDRAAAARLALRARRDGVESSPVPNASDALERFSQSARAKVFGQRLSAAKRFDREIHKGTHEEIINERVIRELNCGWEDISTRLGWIGGKEAFSSVSREIQERLGVSITAASVIDAMRLDEIPTEMVDLIRQLDAFSRGETPADCDSNEAESLG